jgi:hypothetical protein
VRSSESIFLAGVLFAGGPPPWRPDRPVFRRSPVDGTFYIQFVLSADQLDLRTRESYAQLPTMRRRAVALAAGPAALVYAADVAIVQTSLAGDRWAPQPGLNWSTPHAGANALLVNRSVTWQPIIGFGGAFTECAAANYQLLSSAPRAEVMRAYFSESGLRCATTLQRVRHLCQRPPVRIWRRNLPWSPVNGAGTTWGASP